MTYHNRTRIKLRAFCTRGGDMVWTSIRCSSAVSPRHWLTLQNDGSVLLKDTGGGRYKNELIDPETFHYELPMRADPPLANVEALVKEAKAEKKKMEIRLFSTAHAFDHYLGEWFCKDMIESPNRRVLVLARNSTQSDVLKEAYKLTVAYRSRSEAKHLDVLKEWLPDWHIRHEPETAVGLDAPLVRDGKMRSFAGNAYTHDYVAASPNGSKRLCIESKANEESLDETAREKCRALRDGSLTRVVALVDHGKNLKLIDFGPPGCTFEKEMINPTSSNVRTELLGDGK